jgi:hypothetical protein
MALQSVREHVVDNDESWAGRRRAKRWTWLSEAFPDLSEMSVVDLGGEPGTWLQSLVHPKHVHLVNIERITADVPDWMEVDFGDACALPDAIANRQYDLVFSNSVIEHVGGHERRLRFAESVHNLATRHWVQTPYRYFPIEPHWVAPSMQLLPVRARASVACWWPLAKVKSADLREAVSSVLWTDLVDRTQMRYLFPDSTLRSERVLGLTKSLIAIRTD